MPILTAKPFRLPLLTTALAILIGACSAPSPVRSSSAAVPAPALDVPKNSASGPRTAVFAGGCFWGMQWVFEHVRGVDQVVSGYAGGSAATAHYDIVSGGGTGHAESVRVRYDPNKVSYGQLLRVYFSVATDPTQRNRQGPDVGTQYRGVIFTTDDEQARVARAYVAQLEASKTFSGPIVTQVRPLPAFYPAEDYHQDYARLNPRSLYIVINDAPKITQLAQVLPSLYRSTPVTYDP